MSKNTKTVHKLKILQTEGLAILQVPNHPAVQKRVKSEVKNTTEDCVLYAAV